jgi:predicted nucleic acid-binding protein
LDLVQTVVGELVIPDVVYEEIVLRGAGKPGAEEVQQAAWIRRAQVQDQTFADQLPQKLHSGEREALALARELGGALLVDEQAVRHEAQQVKFLSRDSSTTLCHPHFPTTCGPTANGPDSLRLTSPFS